MARRCLPASKPEPSTATDTGAGTVSRSAASAEVAAVRYPVTELPSSKATSWVVAWSNSAMR
jgi:hypothetical protein